MITLNVPYHHQHTSYTCGPATLEMIYEFFGKKATEKQLVKELKTTRKGTKHSLIIQSARKHGFYCFIHDKATIHHLQHYLQKDLPVIVHYLEPQSNEGHYAIIIGYHKNKLILNDPWGGKNFKLNIKEFTKRWVSEEGNFKRWMMVLSKKEFNLGRQYKPTNKNKKLRPVKNKNFPTTKT